MPTHRNTWDLGIYRNAWGFRGIPVGSFASGQHYLEAGHSYWRMGMPTWTAIRILGDL